MNYIFKLIILFFSSFFFFSCVTTGGIEDFYKSNFSENELTPECYLQEGEEPSAYYSSDLSNDINFLRSNYYQILGYSTFNGPAKGDVLIENVKNMCKLKKAKIGLYNYEYTDTRHGVYTTYGGGISSYDIKRYDYTIILFVKLPNWYIQNQTSGFKVKDLDSNSRMALQRNTGAVIDVVYNKSNAFFANVIRNDILIEINGVPILNADDYYNFISTYSGTTFSLKLIRNGQELNIKY
jgi:hypothetical protein